MGAASLDDTPQFPFTGTGGDHELVNTPALLALRISQGFQLKALAVVWMVMWLFFAALCVVGVAWFLVFLPLIIAAAGPYWVWNRRSDLVVTLSSEWFCIYYPTGELLQVPTRHILAFENVPLVVGQYEEDDSTGGYVEALEAPTEAHPTLSFGLLPVRDTNPSFGHGLDEGDRAIFATAFNDWLVRLRGEVSPSHS